MKAVLRIVAGYFSLLPWQNWANVIGAALLGFGSLLTLRAPDISSSFSTTFGIAMPGALLIAILPLSIGGMAMRIASTRSLMHLRPHGRACMLLGTTLTIMLLATVLTLPVLAQSQVFAKFGRQHMSSAGNPANLLLVWCGCAIATWLMVFVASRARILTILVPLLALFFVLNRNWMLALEPEWMTVIATILSAWAIFTIWYSWGPRIHRPTWIGDSTPLGFGSFAIAPLERRSSISGDNALARARRQYLLASGSLLANVTVIALPALLVLLVMRRLPGGDAAHEPPAQMMFPFTFIGSSLGFMIVRRSRFLWLREALDRPALFRFAERVGLSTALLMFGVGAAILLAGSMPGRWDQAPSLLLYGATLGILTICHFYFGLFLTRGWNVEDVLAGVGLGILMLAVLIATKPNQQPSTRTVLIAAALLALLAALLRWLALRRWRTLDWRVAKLPRPGKT